MTLHVFWKVTKTWRGDGDSLGRADSWLRLLWEMLSVPYVTSPRASFRWLYKVEHGKIQTTDVCLSLLTIWGVIWG